MKKFLKNGCISVMILIMFGLSVQLPVAQAAMVGTDQIVQQHSYQQEREKIIAFLDRAEVRQQLQGYGVAWEDARDRVASLTDQEVQMLAGRVDQLPAGGDAAGALVGAVVFIFVVLLITDILGLTNVFSFDQPVR